MKRFLKMKSIGLAGYLFLVLGLHVNAILKADDPIRDTQTEEILYDQKMEQEKDGVKAPATPKVIYYGGQGFLTRPSVTKKDDAAFPEAAPKKKNIFNWSDWWDEKSADEPLSEEQDDADESAQEEAILTDESKMELGGEVSEPVSAENPSEMPASAQNPDLEAPVDAPAEDAWW